MDADVARIYSEARIEGLRPSFVKELIRLHVRGPMTITQLADEWRPGCAGAGSVQAPAVVRSVATISI
jgi:hypothetical protein